MSEFLYKYNGKLNYKFGKKTDNKCHVSYDPSIIDNKTIDVEKNKKKINEEYEEKVSQLKDLSNKSKFSQASLSSSMGKDERKFKLNSLINDGKCKTLESASKLIGVSEKTIITYLKEMNIQMYDASKEKFVGSNKKDAKKVEI